MNSLSEGRLTDLNLTKTSFKLDGRVLLNSCNADTIFGSLAVFRLHLI